MAVTPQGTPSTFTSSDHGGSGGTDSVPPPSGISAGEIWVLLVAADSGGAAAIDVPTGFTAVHAQIEGERTWPEVRCFWKLAAGGDSNASLVTTGTYVVYAVGLRLSGADTSAPIGNVATATSSGQTDTLNAPDVTIQDNGNLAILFLGTEGHISAITVPSGTTAAGTARTGSDVFPAGAAAYEARNIGSYAPGNWTATRIFGSNLLSGAAVTFEVRVPQSVPATYSGPRRSVSPSLRAPWHPTQFARPRRSYFIPTSTAQSAVVGQVTETDTAQAVGRVKAKAIGQAVETDTAQALTDVKARAVSQVTETDTAQPIARLKARALGQTTEADSAQAVTEIKTRAVAQASETNTAQAVTRTKSRAVGQVAETDTAQTVTPSSANLVATATETDTAQPIGRLKVKALGLASETSTAQTLAALKTRLVAQAVETALAQAVAAAKAKALGQAQELDEAQTIVQPGVVHQVTETDTALPVGRRKLKAIGVAEETDAAFALAVGKRRTLAQALETDAAIAITAVGPVPTAFPPLIVGAMSAANALIAETRPTNAYIAETEEVNP